MRIVIFVAVVLAAGGVCYWFTRPTCEWTANEVYSAFDAGHITLGFERLAACETSLCVGRARLCRVYLLQADGRLREAAEELANAKAWAERKGGPNINREIALVGALQHLLEGDGELAGAELQGEQSLLRGIAAYYCEEWAAAATLLREAADPDRRWLRTATHHQFPTTWCREARANSLLELGDHAGARATIGTPHHPLAAKSLLRQATDLPPDEALPLYSQISTASTRGLQEELIHAALQRCDETEILMTLSRCLEPQGQLKLARLLVPHLPREPLDLPCLSQAAAEQMERLLATGSFAAAKELIPLCSDQAPLDEIERQIVRTAVQDPDQLEMAITLWEACNPDGSGKLHLSLLLLDCCEGRWAEKGAHALLRLASALPDSAERPTFSKELSRAMHAAYDQALAENNSAALLLLLQSSNYFGIKGLRSLTAAEVANQVADIHHLLQLGREKEARRRARWLVKVDPTCTAAHAILGQLAHAAGRHAEALAHLRALAYPDGETLEQLAVCEILVGNAERGEALLQALALQGHSLGEEASGLLTHLALSAETQQLATLDK